MVGQGATDGPNPRLIVQDVRCCAGYGHAGEIMNE